MQDKVARETPARSGEKSEIASCDFTLSDHHVATLPSPPPPHRPAYTCHHQHQLPHPTPTPSIDHLPRISTPLPPSTSPPPHTSCICDVRSTPIVVVSHRAPHAHDRPPHSPPPTQALPYYKRPLCKRPPPPPPYSSTWRKFFIKIFIFSPFLPQFLRFAALRPYTTHFRTRSITLHVLTFCKFRLRRCVKFAFYVDFRVFSPLKVVNFQFFPFFLPLPLPLFAIGWFHSHI